MNLVEFWDLIYQNYSITSANGMLQKSLEVLQTLLIDEFTIFNDFNSISNDEAKDLKNQISLPTIKQYLETKDHYIQQKPPSKHRIHRWSNIGDRYVKWQMDLIHTDTFSDKYKFVLTIIDCFSKFAWCITINIQ